MEGENFIEESDTKTDPTEEVGVKAETWPAEKAGMNANKNDTVAPEENSDRYYQATIQAPAFGWLISMLKREQKLDRSKLDHMRGFSKQISRYRPSLSISRKRVQHYKATYTSSWDVRSFLKDQKYEEPPEVAIEGAIVLVGTEQEAQAMTCGEYLRQTWPMSGPHILSLLKNLLRNIGEQNCKLNKQVSLAHTSFNNPKVASRIIPRSGY